MNEPQIVVRTRKSKEPSTLDSPRKEFVLSVGDESSSQATFPRSALALLAATVVLGSFLIVGTKTFTRVLDEVDLLPLLATASLVILLGMAALYSYMYRFYSDEFYAFVAVAWIGNAFYMFLEGFLRPQPSTAWTVGLCIYAFAQLSLVPFYIASFWDRRKGLEGTREIAGLVGWFGWMIISFAIGRWLTIRHGSPTGTATTLFFETLGGIPFAFWTLFRVGRSAEQRLGASSHRLWATMLPLTFYVYAALQFLSPLRLYTSAKVWANGAFTIGLFLKIVNSISAAMILALDSSARLKHRSVLEDLGALAASIEHDVSNPLQVIETVMDGMKERFQANQEVILNLKKIEEQNRRIFASTEIVSILRGGREFYGKLVERTSVTDLVIKSVKAVKDAMSVDDIRFVREDKMVYIRAYRPLLQQAVVNVLKNAVEAIREARPKVGVVRIAVKDSDGNGHITVEISDNGGGIPAAAMQKLGHFYTTKKDKKANSGIGLFVSSRILDFQDGTLQVESKEGEGTTVTLSLPEWKHEKPDSVSGSRSGAKK